MREASGDLWEYPAEAIVITTNGVVNRKGEAVMGRGVALQAKQRYPWLPHHLGWRIAHHGNIVHLFDCPGRRTLASFPVKHHWRERADLGLIERSCRELVSYADGMEWETVAMPRPGCGAGQLAWPDVKGLIAPLLDDRFVIVDLAS